MYWCPTGLRSWLCPIVFIYTHATSVPLSTQIRHWQWRIWCPVNSTWRCSSFPSNISPVKGINSLCFLFLKKECNRGDSITFLCLWIRSFAQLYPPDYSSADLFSPSRLKTIFFFSPSVLLSRHWDAVWWLTDHIAIVAPLHGRGSLLICVQKSTRRLVKWWWHTSPIEQQIWHFFMSIFFNGF